MANAKKCDRCGRLYEFYDADVSGYKVNAVSLVHRYSHGGSGYDTRLVADLCPKCMDEFTNWILEKENNNESISE